MTSIYVDPSALLLAAPDEETPDDLLAPGAQEALTHLVEAGFDVVLLGEGVPSPDALPEGLHQGAELPQHLDADAWYLTGQPYPSFGRPRGGTTVLVGPHRPEGKLPLPRFDLETRDLGATAMEILTRQAMA